MTAALGRDGLLPEQLHGDRCQRQSLRHHRGRGSGNPGSGVVFEAAP